MEKEYFLNDEKIEIENKTKLPKLNRTQYWFIIGIAFGLLIVNGYLVVNLVKGEVEFDKTCPVPVDEINYCDCVYSSLGDKSLRYCVCYPGEKFDISKSIEVENGSRNE